MNTLLSTLKTHVKTAYPGIRGVEVTPHLSAVPSGAGFPAVGLVDGGIQTLTEDSYMREEALSVTIAVYVRYVKEADITGTAGIEAITKALKDYFSTLDINNYQITVASPESGIVAGNLDQDFVIAKTIELRIIREVILP